MSPLDDSLRDALRRQAQAVGADQGADVFQIEARARTIQRRRGAVAALGSAVAIGVVAAVVVSSSHLGKTASPVSATPSSPPTVAESPAPSPSPSLTPPVGSYPASSVASWGFRGDQTVWARSWAMGDKAYVSYRHSSGDPVTIPRKTSPLYAGVMINQSGDVITFLEQDNRRVARAVTVMVSEGGATVVADQPVSTATVLVDALLQADPARIVLAIGPPATGQISYRLDKNTTPEKTVSGISQFGRALESKGGTSDAVVIFPDGNGRTSVERVPGAFTVDVSQPGRLGNPDGAAQWVYSSWLAGDRLSAKRHVWDDPTLTKLFGFPADPNLAPRPCAKQPQGTAGDPLQYTCAMTSRGGRTLIFTVSGTPSLGFGLADVRDMVP